MENKSDLHENDLAGYGLKHESTRFPYETSDLTIYRLGDGRFFLTKIDGEFRYYKILEATPYVRKELIKVIKTKAELEEILKG